MPIGERQVGKIEKQLRMWSTVLDDLVARPRISGTASRAGYREHLDDLQSKHQLLRAQFDRLKAAGRSERPDLEIGFDTAWKDIESSFAKLPG